MIALLSMVYIISSKISPTPFSRGSGKSALLYILLFLLVLGTAHHAAARMDQTLTGTRPMGMAGAFLTVGGDGNSIVWNPAAMPFVRHQDLGFSYHVPADMLDIAEHNLSYLFAITDRHAVGVDWFRTGFDDEEYEFGENRFSLAYGYNVYKSLSFGVSLKYLTQTQTLDKADSFKASGTGLDLGIMYSPIEKLRLGITALDAADTWMKFSQGGRDKIYSRTLRYGASYQPIRSLTIAADYDAGLHVGAEYWFANTVAVRGGVYNNFETGDGIRYAAGGSFKYRVLQLDYAFNTHPMLPDTHRVSMSLAFELTPTLVKIEEIETQPVFATLYRQYSTDPIGKVTLRNKRSKPLPVTVSVFIPEYMEAPTEIAQDVVLIGQVGDELTFADPIAIKPVLSDTSLTVEQNTQTQAEITVTYEYLNRTHTVRKNGMVTIYRPGILPLGDSVAPIAALIDPFDPAVENFAREIVSRYGGQQRMKLINKKISQAMQLYNALNGIGVKYVPDPDNPYGMTEIDSVKYPQTILALNGTKTGDCDDESALYAALLESVGIRTQLVGTPGHVYVMFDSGIHKRKAAMLSLPEDRYVNLRGSSNAWIPIEITRFGNPDDSSFPKAWDEGLREYHQWMETDQVEVVDVHRAWNTGYNYSHPPGKAPEVDMPPRTKVDPIIQTDIVAVQRERYTYLAALEQRVNEHPEDMATANKLAVTLAFWKRYDQAIQRINEVLDQHPDNATALNNLGNIYTMQGKISEAQVAYRRASEADSVDPGIQLNEGLAHKVKGNDKQADEMITSAIQSAGGAMEAEDLLGISSTADIRGEATRMVANQIRILISNLAGEGDSMIKLTRASESIDQEEQEFYLYWKE